MAKNQGRGSNAFEGKKGWQPVAPKFSVAPTPNHSALNGADKVNDKQTIITLPISPGEELNKIYNNYKKKIQRTGRAPRLSEEEYYKAFIVSGVGKETARKAAIVLSTNPPILIATSGKLASGKDSITAKVAEKLGCSNYYHLLLSAPLKDEAQIVLDDIRASHNREEAIVKVMSQNVQRHEAMQVVKYAYDEARNEPEVTSRGRTAWLRIMLQYWGMEVRRNQDIGYWLNKATLLAANAIAEGKDIIVTDIRFPDEVDRLQSIGFTVARLDITPEVQAKRLEGRDGLNVDAATLNHASEVSLDSYVGFNIRVENNEGTMDEVVDNVLEIFNR